MKEKTKELLLQDMSRSNSVSHHELKTSDFNSLSSSSSYHSTGSFKRPSFLPTEEAHLDVSADDRPLIADWASHDESNRKMREILNWTTPIADQSREMERQYQEQLAIVLHEAELERQRHQETLQQVMNQTRALLDRANSTNIDRMIPSLEQPSSSSSAPNRLPIQDVEQARLAIQDVEQAQATAAAIAIKDSSGSSSDPEVSTIKPGMLQPRSEDVKHLYRPKNERAKKRVTSWGSKEYFDTFEE